MKMLYIDCFSGASGDMLMGALLDAGASEKALREGLVGLGLEGTYRLNVGRVLKSGIRCTKVDVTDARGEAMDAPYSHHDHEHHGGHAHGHAHAHDASHEHRGLTEILARIRGAGLPARAQSMACEVFTRLGETEAAIHGTTPDEVHFHEVGGVDAMIDIVGVCLLVCDLAPDRIVASPVNVGFGRVRCAHGILPVPAPATAALLRGVPTYAGPVRGEMCTPTGAALITVLAGSYGPQPAMRVDAIGYGAGARDAPLLNAVRVLVGAAEGESGGQDEIRVLECHVDDMTGEELGLLIEDVMSAGALDAAAAPLTMKKGRPGHAVTVLTRPGDEGGLADLLLRRSTTLGVRHTAARRTILPRHTVTVETAFGVIDIKCAGDKIKPEFDHLKRASREYGVSIDRVRAAALAAYAHASEHSGME